MKKRTTFILLALALLLCVGLLSTPTFADGDRYLEINETNFPDANFRQWIMENLAGGKDYMTEAEVNSVIFINCAGNDIKSIEGIERFPMLLKFACHNNQLTELDVSKNPELTYLECENNKLTKLDLSKNPALQYLFCFNNQLEKLDVSKNTELIELDCWCNRLPTLDFSNNTALIQLNCGGNKLSTLDVSKNVALQGLGCGENELTSLDVSMNTALCSLACYDNKLTVLDVSKNTALIGLSCGNNQLTTLDVTRNTVLNSFSCNSNQLTALDVSKNTALTRLDCSENQLTALDLSHNTALSELLCRDNRLDQLDLDNNTALQYIYCQNNQLIKLDVNGIPALRRLWCQNNQLTVLNVSKNAALAELYCYSNRLTTLDVSYDTALRELMCEENQLIALDVSKNTALSRLYCGGNQLKALDVSSNVALIELHCDNSRLTALDVSNNKAITELWCHNNQIPMLDLRGNAKVSEPALWQQIAGQVLTHVNGRYQFDLSKLIPLNYMTNVTVSDDADLNKDTGIVSFSKKVESFVYQYDTGRGAMDVTITFGNGGSDPTPEPTATPAPTPTPAPNALTIVQQPKDVKVKSGSKAKFTVKAKEKNVTYQWFSKAPKGDWTLMKGETQNKLTVAASGANNGYQYRCLVKNREGGQAYSRAAKLTVTLQPPVIKTQPKDLNVKSGAKAKFSVKASGKNISYQWYERFDAKSEWKLMKGETRNTLQVVASKATDGHQYYCHLKNTDGEADSKTAKLMVKTEAPTIKTQPKSVTVKSGKKAKFSVKASGKNLKYQWYERANADAEWTAVNGGTKNSLSVETSKAKNGCQYYCKVTNPDGTVNSAVATLTVTPEAPVIKTQPKDVKVKAGAKVKFKVKASPKSVTYQWYYRENENAEWKLIKGATKAEYSFEASAEMFGWQFRCLARNADGQAWSKIATLLKK